MTILEWLQDSMVRLRDAGVDSPRRDCLVLVEDLLEKDRAWILARHEVRLTDKQIASLNQHLQRRINREPLAYIRGKAWFYGRFFKVSKEVLVPRPESESFITLLKNIDKKTRTQASAAMSIVDVGTGSGCLAITAKLELPDAHVTAVDIDPKALEIAKFNSRQLEANINFIQGSLLKPIDDTPAAIIANLPYVPEGMITSPEITKEPAGALFSGTDGLDHYRKFWEQINELYPKPNHILTESLLSQHKEVRKLAQASGYSLHKTDCLVQHFSLD